MKKCSHLKRVEVGTTQEGIGEVIVEWCPNCGAIKRTMINWEYTDYPWRFPKRLAKGETTK